MPDNSNYQFRAVPLDLVSYVTKKPKSAKYYFRYLLNRTMMMFEYKNLPPTIDPQILERYLQVNGVACVAKADDGNLYCFNGSWGGIQDVYYRPTKFIVSNPHISQLSDGTGKTFTKEFTIFGTQPHDAVLMRNDTEWASLTPLIARYAVMMCENCVTVRTATIMLRCLALLSADSDSTKKSAEAYLAKLENGDLGVIAETRFSKGINLQSPPSNNGSYLTQFIELQQYLKGSFFNELGLRANYNMKREAIGQGESTLDADSILPLCDNMLKCRKEDICEINNLFNLDVQVNFSSAWLENHLESSINIISQLNEAGVTDGDDIEVSGSAQNGAFGALNGANGDVGTDGMDGTDDTNKNKEGEENAGRENTDQSNENSDGSSGSGDSGAGEGTEGNDDKVEESGDGETSAGDDDSGEGSGGTGEEDKKIEEIKDELASDELSFVEGAMEVVNDKISQLVADARKGDLDE